MEIALLCIGHRRYGPFPVGQGIMVHRLVVDHLSSFFGLCDTS